MSEWKPHLEFSSLLDDGDYPLVLIYLDQDSVLGFKLFKSFVDHYRKISPEGRAWMDGKLEEIFQALKKTLTQASSQ